MVGENASDANDASSSKPDTTQAARPRIIFDPEPEVAKILATKRGTRGGQKRYLNDVVKFYERPPYKFHLPQYSPASTSLDLLIGGAASNLIVFGLSLGHLIEQYGEIIKYKVLQQRLTLTVLVLKQPTGSDDYLYQALLHHRGSRDLVERTLTFLRRSTLFFQLLKREASEHGVFVDLRQCNDVPKIGLIVRDHNAPIIR